MSAADVSRVRSVPGRLCYSPSLAGLSGAFAHEGTEIGHVVEVHVRQLEELTPVVSEARGQLVAAVRGASRYILGFRLIQWDIQMLRRLFRVTEVNIPAVSGTAGSVPALRSSYPGLISPGTPILFSPDDADHPAILIYSPIPDVSAGRRLDFAIDKGLDVDVALLAAADSNGNDIAIGRLNELVSVGGIS